MKKSWIILPASLLLAALSLSHAKFAFARPELTCSLVALSLAGELLAAPRPGGRFSSLAPAIQLLAVWLQQVHTAWLLALLGLAIRLAVPKVDRFFLVTQGFSRALQMTVFQLLLPSLGPFALVPAALIWLTLDRSGPAGTRVAALCSLPLLQAGALENLAYLWLALPALSAASKTEDTRSETKPEAGETMQVHSKLGQTQQRLHEAQQRLGERQFRENTFWELGQRLLTCQDTSQWVNALRLDLERRLTLEAVVLVVNEVYLLQQPEGLKMEGGVPRQPGPFSPHPHFSHGWIVPLSQGYLCCARSQTSGPFQSLDLAYLDTLAGLLEISWRNLEAQQQSRERLADWMEAAKTAAVGQLSAGVAHELNSPLAALRLNLDLARKKADRPDEVVGRINAALVPLDNAQRIIERLLYYSRDGSMETRILDLNQVIRDIALFLTGDYQRQGIRLATSLTELPTLSGHPSELQQLILNLLDNARQAGSRNIWLTTSAAAGSVQLLIQDDGAGLAPAVAARMFEPFFTTRPPGHGVGLGLAVAQKIAQRHGGRLQGRNRSPGPGAEFLLVL